MLTGPNGLLTQAKDAKTKTEEAGAKEKMQIAVAGSWGENGFDAGKFKTEVGRVDGTITPGEEEFPIKVTVDGQNFEVSEEGVVTEKGKNTTGGDTVTPGVEVTESNKTYEDEDGDTAVIPVGFAIVPGLNDVSQGLVISDVENDTDNKGNQFVWIPVEKAEDYKTNTTYDNTDVSQNIENDTGYLPTFNAEDKVPDGSTDAEKEKNLVISKGGFYISRYEAGDGLATSLTYRTDGSGTTGKLISKKDAYVYNYISQDDAKEKAKTFINTENVKSALVSGIQWDMVMAFISKETRKDGNRIDDYVVTTGNSTRHKGSDVGVQQSGKNEADRVCNIYDLEGNCCEYVAEKNTYSTNGPYVSRGGHYLNNYSASDRGTSNGFANSLVSFRFVLYVM